jgi:hypothetical protein
MPSIENIHEQNFWSDIYRGRHIAVFNHHGRWHAYLDHTFLPSAVFATAENAVRWLVECVDLPPRRAA